MTVACYIFTIVKVCTWMSQKLISVSEFSLKSACAMQMSFCCYNQRNSLVIIILLLLYNYYDIIIKSTEAFNKGSLSLELY